MRRLVVALGVAAAGLASAGGLYAQDMAQERAPVANAIGRFFGFGYSAGYHAQVESRYGLHHYAPTHNVVPQPPRGMHAVPAMQGYHQPAYGQVYGQPSMQVMGAPQLAPQLSILSQDMVPAPVQPAKPVVPPPTWLKQFLKDQPPGNQGNAPGSVLPNSQDGDSLLSEPSPSDRRGVQRQSAPRESSAGLSITSPDEPAPVQIGGRPVVSVLQQ